MKKILACIPTGILLLSLAPLSFGDTAPVNTANVKVNFYDNVPSAAADAKNCVDVNILHYTTDPAGNKIVLKSTSDTMKKPNGVSFSLDLPSTENSFCKIGATPRSCGAPISSTTNNLGQYVYTVESKDYATFSTASGQSVTAVFDEDPSKGNFQRSN